MIQNKPRHADMMVKICGMADEDNIADVAHLAPMLMGFIFHEPSPRNALSLNPDVVKRLPSYIHPVGVFVNKDDTYILDVCRRYGIKAVQLHGDEMPEQCKRLKDSGLAVFKAIGIGSSLPIELLKSYSGNVDMFVFDTLSPKRGGTGNKFDWNLLEDYHLDIPYMIGGGVAPDDVDEIVASMRPGFVGIDINSRFEVSPGHKDLPKLINFLLSLRKYNEYEPTSIPFWEKEK